MKKITVLLAIAASNSYAQLPPVELPPLPPTVQKTTLDVSFPYGIPIVEFSRFILQDILKVPFMLSQEFISSSDRVGFEKKGIKKENAEALLQAVLNERGYRLTKKSGFYTVARYDETLSAHKETFIYKLKHRPLSFFTAELATLFPQGAFSSQRAVDSAPPQAQSPGLKNDFKANDNGTNAYSQISKNDSDFMLFTGTKNEIQKLKGLLEVLDVPSNKVTVKAFIVEVSNSTNDTSSLNLVANVLNSKLSLNLGSPVSGNSLVFKLGNFDAAFSALSGDSSFTVSSAPAVLVTSGGKATIKHISKIPVLGSIQTLSGGQTQQSIEYVDVGSILDVSPTVLEKSIKLDLTQNLSTYAQSEVQLAPIISESSYTSSITLSPGDTVLLGGVSDARDNKTSSNFFGLPLGSNKQKSSKDIVLMLKVE